MGRRIHFNETCLIDGCDRLPDAARGMCEMHYTRVKKHGDPGPAIPTRTFDGRVLMGKSGYIRIWEPTHPLANSDGYVLEHRKVFYDAGHTVPLGHQVHHVNGDKADNRIENLEVLSESDHHKHHIAEAGFVINQRGTWPLKVPGAVCFLEGCDKPVHARGLCNAHYLKWRRGRLVIEAFA